MSEESDFLLRSRATMTETPRSNASSRTPTLTGPGADFISQQTHPIHAALIGHRYEGLVGAYCITDFVDDEVPAFNASGRAATSGPNIFLNLPQRYLLLTSRALVVPVSTPEADYVVGIRTRIGLIGGQGSIFYQNGEPHPHADRWRGPMGRTDGKLFVSALMPLPLKKSEEERGVKPQWASPGALPVSILSDHPGELLHTLRELAFPNAFKGTAVYAHASDGRYHVGTIVAPANERPAVHMTGNRGRPYTL